MIKNIHKFIKKIFINYKDNILKFYTIYYKGMLGLVDGRLEPPVLGRVRTSHATYFMEFHSIKWSYEQ